MLKRKVLKIASLMLALVMALSLFTGCGAQKETTKEETTTEKNTASESTAAEQEPKNSWEIDKSPVTLKMFIDFQGWEISKYWGVNPVTKKFIEDTGVNLEVTYAPDADHSKLNVLIASGDLPDFLYMGPGLPQSVQLAQNDKVWAINELADQYAKDFLDKVPNNVLVAKRMEYDSMNFYMAPFFYTADTMMDKPFIPKNMTGVTVEKNIYEAIGKPEIKTADDYINMLRTVKQKYPDMIPVQSYRGAAANSNPNVIFMASTLAGLNPYYKDGGTWKSQYEHPNYLKVLKFANTLYQEKLMSSAELTSKSEQLVANIKNAKVYSEIAEDADNLDYWSTEASKVTPDFRYMMIEPFTIDPSTKPAYGGFGDGSGWAGVMITKSSKHTDRAIRYLSYLYDEKTQMNIIFGIEGVHYDMVDGLPVMKQEFLDARKQDTAKSQNEEGLSYLWPFRNAHWQPLLSLQESTSEYFKAGMEIGSKYYDNEWAFYNNGINGYATESEEAKIFSVINDYLGGMLPKILLAKPDDVEKMYNEMLEQLKKLGLDKLTAFNGQFLDEKQAKIDKYSK